MRLLIFLLFFCRISSSLNPSNPIAWNRRRQWRQGTGCGTWQLDTTSNSTTADISQTEISCSENRKPLCIKPTDPSLDITFEFTGASSARRRKNKGRGRGRNQVNKRRQSLRWKQRKNKRSEKVGFTQRRKRQGRSVNQAEARQAGQGCDPIEVRYVIQNM